MKLREALQLLNARSSGGAAPYAVHLVTGFEPLHLKTFLAAHLSQCLAAQGDPRTVDVRTGLYGDFGGNWSRAIEEAGTVPVAAVLEWADLHPAMGWREAALSASWDQGEALSEIESRLRAWLILLREAGPGRRFLALPALPLPPWVQRGLDGQSSSFELELRALVAQFARDAARAGARVAASCPTAAWDAGKELSTGFPFTLEFASELAERLARLILPATPKKGIVTDLDRTLWRGVVGDDGPSAVSWDLDRQARVHGWWQQFLASMGKQGVLIGVASKNDREPVEQALARHDLLVPTDSIFPLEVNWGDKAASIRRIAAAWNIGLDSIVFVDDNQLELEEVRQALPEVECILFPADDPAAVAAALFRLRDLFGKESISSDDLLRVATLRQRATVAQELGDIPQAGGGSEERYAALGSRIRLDCRRPPEARVLELINKTNQFNLNGRRWEESCWLAWCRRPEARVALVGYEDRFGPLGNIAAVAAECAGEELHVRSWVMSCRAFSRRIEYSTLHFLLARWPCKRILFDWRRTERNGPMQQALHLLFDELPQDGILEIAPDALRSRLPRQHAFLVNVLDNV